MSVFFCTAGFSQYSKYSTLTRYSVNDDPIVHLKRASQARLRYGLPCSCADRMLRLVFLAFMLMCYGIAMILLAP